MQKFVCHKTFLLYKIFSKKNIFEYNTSQLKVLVYNNAEKVIDLEPGDVYNKIKIEKVGEINNHFGPSNTLEVWLPLQIVVLSVPNT